ncbi:MAG: hypothetical protein JRN09_09345 [Nitrososphaerota archaeon]|nr:hypothetical protein [Nitrososphaerota archaeon]
MQFEESLKFEGSTEEVWNRVSAVKDIPIYWHGTKSLEVVGEERNMVHAKIKFAFGGSGAADILTDSEKMTMTLHYTSGPFTGEQVIAVSDGKVTAKWDIRFKGVFRAASKWNESHFRSGTKHALERLTGAQPTNPGA